VSGRKAKRKAAKTWDVGPLRVRGGPAWRLRRARDPDERAKPRKETVSVLGGWRADYVLPLIVDVVRRQGYEAESISSRVRPYPLTEEEGYRLALAFRLVRRSKSARRVEAMVNAIRGFESEEAYLWYSYLSRAAVNGRASKLAAALANLGETL
jgi:hypothetical protein